MTEPDVFDLSDAAQAWHDERLVDNEHDGEEGACWCCCTPCQLGNPHYAEAQAAWRAT